MNLKKSAVRFVRQGGQRTSFSAPAKIQYRADSSNFLEHNCKTQANGTDIYNNQSGFLELRRRAVKGICLATWRPMYAKPDTSPVPNDSSRRYVALCLWFLIAVMFFSLARQWIVFTSADRELTEYVEGVLRRATYDHRSAREIRVLVLAKAQQLSLPVQPERINITGQGQTLQTLIAYDTEIKFPLIGQVLYRMEFNHNLSYQPSF